MEVNIMYRAKETIISCDYYNFTIKKESYVQLKSIMIKNGNIYANLENDGEIYILLLEVFQKYFEKVKF